MFLQVKYTSALTNTISGTAKACVQTMLAAVIFKNPISVTVSVQFRTTAQRDRRISNNVVQYLERDRYSLGTIRIRVLWLYPLQGTSF